MLAWKDLDRLRVVMVSTRNPLNLGAAPRPKCNFGVRRLRVVNPFERAFREAKSAVGAADLLAEAEEFSSVSEAVADCTLVVGTTAVRDRDLQHPVYRLEHGGRLIRKHLLSGKVALLFGSEKFGLSNQALSHCQWLMRIPTSDDNISMNLGQAVAVCLYELIRSQGRLSAPEKAPVAKAAELERITASLLQALQLSGYMDRRAVSDVDDRMRRLILRMKLPARDATLWLGIWRQILWKLGPGSQKDDFIEPPLK